MGSTEHVTKMFKSSETANDLFRRVHPVTSFELKPSIGPAEKIGFGTDAELQTTDGSAAEMVLSVALQFAAQF